MKKRILALVMIAVLAFGLTACGKAAKVAKDVVDNAVEENNAASNKKESEGTLTFEVPEGFTLDAAQQLYVSEDGMANINYQTLKNDGSFSAVTESLMEVSLESQLSAQMGEQLDITITEWIETEVDGYDAIDYTIEYTLSGIQIVQTQIIIDGTDNLHYLTFTQMAGADYADAFAACEDSMKFE